MSGTFDLAENTVISRVDNVVHINVVSAATFLLISQLVGGKTLAEAADFAFDTDEAFDLGAALAFILSQSIFKSINSSELPK